MADFITSMKFDPRIAQINDKVLYQVVKGSADNNFVQENANSKSSTNVTFSLNPPSESTVIDKNILVRATMKFKVVITGVPAADTAWSYGNADAFQSWPLNRLFQNVTCTINNTSTSINQASIMPALVRMIPEDDLQKFNGFTPTMNDNYGVYQDGASSLSVAGLKAVFNNPLAGYTNSGHDQFLLGRGAHGLDITGFLVDRNISGGANDTSLISANIADVFTINFTATFTESLMVSPLLFNGGPYMNHAGLLGVNNLGLVIQVDSTLKRMFSTASSAHRRVVPAAPPLNVPGDYVLTNESAGGFETIELLVNYLTAPIIQDLPPKNTLPYKNYVNYQTTAANDIPLRVARTNAGLGTVSAQSVAINSISLEVVPSMIFVYAREPLALLGIGDPDVFLPISSVDITFGNKSGILSSATRQDLWRMSRKNGSKISWEGFKGLAGSWDQASAGVRDVGTCGSLLVFSPAEDFAIQAPYISGGSVGQFNLAMRLMVENNNPDRVIKPEINVIVVRDGIFSTISGMSSLTTGMLNSSTVMETIGADKRGGPVEADRFLTGGARSGGGSSKLSALSM